MTQDHLGSPRVITNENGAVVNRRDFTAFGEESVTAQRTAGLGYDEPEIRKNYTGYEKDAESGLEFAQARYYNPTHGRFTSVDPLTASASIRNPQTFNRYSYVLNSPYKYTDPLGLMAESSSDKKWEFNCDFSCRIKSDRMTKQDMVLMEWHVSNGSALGYWYLNLREGASSRPIQQPTTIDPPQIGIEQISLISRTPKRGKDGEIVSRDGVVQFDEEVLGMGLGPNEQDFSAADSQLNLNGAEGLLNIGETVYLKMTVRLYETRNRSVFDNAAISAIGSVPNIVSQQPVTDYIVSGDGKSATLYFGLKSPADGVSRGKIGTVTFRVQASYIDGYDSTTNQILVPKKVQRDIRISLVNTKPNQFFKKSF